MTYGTVIRRILIQYFFFLLPSKTRDMARRNDIAEGTRNHTQNIAIIGT